MIPQEALTNMINGLEKAQSKGIFTLREARLLADSIDIMLGLGSKKEKKED